MQNKYKRITKEYIILILLFIANISFAQDVIINEFSAINNTVLADEDGMYSDWIELFNTTAKEIDLQGWRLSDEKGASSKWIFPDISIHAGEYLIVFASGKDKNLALSELHTNFKLSGSGEYLALFNPIGIAVSDFDPAFPPQQADYSFGIYEGNYVEFSDPTPGKDNKLSDGIVVSGPVFNIKHGFFDTPFTLTISSSEEMATIYYTSDGSAPSANNGSVYSTAITIDSTTIIRAIAIVNGQPSSSITTQTYIFLDDILDQPNVIEGYPAEWGPYLTISGTAIGDYEMDPEMMNDPSFRDSVKLALMDIPTVSIVTDKEHLFNKTIDEETGGIYIYTGGNDGTGLDWERPSSFEFFNYDGTESLQADCGLRIQGGAGRIPEKSPKHSFRVVFRGEYGIPKLNYPFFGEEASNEINTITLKAGFNNTWYHWDNESRNRAQYIRDSWAKDAQRAMGHPAAHSNYVHLYLNGIYWGLYNPTERLDEDFAEVYLGGNKEDYDVIKDFSEILAGNSDAWDEMMAQANSGLSSNEAYQKIQGNNPDGTNNPQYERLVNIENLIDYMLINFYGGNTDWDHHNWVAMRNRTKPGQGFSFLCWDEEQILIKLSENNVNEFNENCPSNLFQRLTENKDFKRLLADRLIRNCYNNGVLSPKTSAELWNVRSKEIEKAVQAEAARWGDYRRDVHPYKNGPYERYDRENSWFEEQLFMRNSYFPNRTDILISQFREANLFPDVDAPIFYLNANANFTSIISAGDILSMAVAEGNIYYTTNGTDPVNWTESDNEHEIIVLSEDADKRVKIPKTDIGTAWYKDNNYNDSDWQLCKGLPGGVGYEDKNGYEDLISLDVSSEMNKDADNPGTSCYIRIPFYIDEAALSENSVITLKILYDDGFVAYINGKEVERANTSETITWNSTAATDHEATIVESFDISHFFSFLNAGENLLAIHGLNDSNSSSDFIINASIVLSKNPINGTISNEAIPYSGPISMEKSGHIIARAYYNGEWSAANNSFFIIPSDFKELKITEIHYNPPGEEFIDGGLFEFIEIKNTGTSRLDIGGLRFVEGIEFEFPPETELGPGEFIVLASDVDYFYSRYNLYAFDEFKGKLNNDGEQVVLVTGTNDTICNFKYNDGNTWPQGPDGQGNSLVSVSLNPVNEQQSPLDWRSSFYIGGSPGKDDLDYTSVQNQKEEISTGIILGQNYPNPFSEFTYIDYQISEEAYVKLMVYNMMGQHIATLVDEKQNAGLYQAEWNGFKEGIPSEKAGIYFYRIEVQSRNQNAVVTKKMLLIR